MMTINMTRFNKQPKISFSDSRIVKSSAKNKKQIPIKFEEKLLLFLLTKQKSFLLT